MLDNPFTFSMLGQMLFESGNPAFVGRCAPHSHTVPSFDSATACELPAAIAFILFSPTIRSGADLEFLVPSANWQL
jgi:hypothetical protein